MKIRREIVIDGQKKWITASNEQDYVEKVLKLYGKSETPTSPIPPTRHIFEDYALRWFEVFAQPNVELVSSITYKRQLTRHIFPAIGKMNVEEITAADIQSIYNAVGGCKSSKMKIRMVLNMIFQQAVEDGYILNNPVKSKSIRITGEKSVETKPYSVEQMRYIVHHIKDVQYGLDRNYIAIQSVHPLRLEEVLGLKNEDINIEGRYISVCRAVTHPSRNQAYVKDTKTEQSHRFIALVPEIIPFITLGEPEDFFLGGKKPLSYSQIRRVCNHIQKDMGFDEAIIPKRFRTTILTDLYDATKDIKQTQAAAGHTTADMTLKYYVKGRSSFSDTAFPISMAYGLKTDAKTDDGKVLKIQTA